MNDNFKNKEEAEFHRDFLTSNLKKCETIGGRFCPLINGACVVGCVCFEMPYVISSVGGDPATWFVYGHYCSNEMFCKDEYNVNVRC